MRHRHEVVALTLALLAGLAAGQPTDEALLERLEREVLGAKVTAATVTTAIAELAAWRGRAELRLSDAERERERHQTELQPLGPPLPDEPAETAARRRELTEAIGQLTGQIERLKQELAHAEEVRTALEAKLERVRDGERLDALVAEALGAEGVTVGRLRAALTEVAALVSKADAAVRGADAELAAVDRVLAALGPAQADESEEVKAMRRAQQDRRRLIELARGEHQLNLVKAQQLSADLERKLNSQATRELLERQVGLAGLVQANLERPEAWAQVLSRLVTTGAGIEAWTAELLTGLVALLAVCFAVGRYVKARARQLAERLAPESFGDLFGRAALTSLSHHAVAVALVGGLAAFTGLVGATAARIPLAAALCYGVLLFLGTRIVVRTLLQPIPPATAYSPLPADAELPLARRLGVLALTGVLGYVLYRAGDELDPAPAVALAVRTLFVTVVCVDLAWLLWLDRRIPALARHHRWLRGAGALLLGVALAAEWSGYRNLATWLLRGLVGTLLLVPLGWLLGRLGREIFGSLARGSAPWATRIRERVGLAPDEPFPGLAWLRFAVWLALLAVGITLLLRLWASDAGYAAVERVLAEGLTVGGLTVVPSRVVTGLTVFGLLMATVQWLAVGLDRHLTRSDLESGARVAAVTLAGYLGTAVAALVGLNAVGLNLTHLAVVAGALSVGIGFGLQNVVNNFVSGIILLFERPIKVGDWIAVGGTEGIVRRISVRSTEIQTFDREDVIVPNANLLSQPVTNKTRHDEVIRAIVPVGVAYGSDVALVMRLLREAAEAHPDVAQTPGSQPVVLFVGFGESALNFELRCVVERGERRLQVISDLHVAIDAAFRAHGVEIPYPQRDVHIRSQDSG